MSKKLLVHEIDYRDYGYIDSCSIDEDNEREMVALINSKYSLCQ